MMAVIRKKKTAPITISPGSLPAPLPPAPAPAPMLTPLHLPIEAKGDAPTYYVNHAEINVTPFEMAITLARLPPRFDEDEHKRFASGERVTIPAVVQILLPINFVPALLAVMTSMKDHIDKGLEANAANAVKQKSDE